MNSRTVTATAAFLLAGVMAGASCVADQSGTTVRLNAICSITEDCTFSATCANQYIGQVLMDTSLTEHVWLVIQVDNPLPNNADSGSGLVNTNDAHVTSFSVTYAGLPLPAAEVGFGSQKVPAGGSSSISAYAIPPEVGAYIAANNLGPTAPDPAIRITAFLKAKGHFDNGRSFESGEYPITIEVCDGCIGPASCPVGDVLSVCPPGSYGQAPVSASCVTP